MLNGKVMYIFTDNALFFTKRFFVFRLANLFEVAGVRKGTYAASIFEKKYDHYFKRAIDLRAQYKRFYKHEYSDYEIFLNQKYFLMPSQVTKFNTERIFYSKLSEYSNYYWHGEETDFLDSLQPYDDDDIIFPIIKKFLEDFS